LSIKPKDDSVDTRSRKKETWCARNFEQAKEEADANNVKWKARERAFNEHVIGACFPWA